MPRLNPSTGKTRPAHRLRRLALAAMVVIVAIPAAAQDDDPRYHAQLSDGTFVAAESLRDWHDVNATPRIGNHPLFDPNRPVRWLLRDAPPAESMLGAYVEIIGGDRLPGEVVGYSSGEESPYRRLPPHLLVRSTNAVRRPNASFDPPVRVELANVRRIVWSHVAGGPAMTNTAVLRDGRRLPFREIRWSSRHVVLLTEDGIETVPFSSLAQLELNDRNAWDAYFDHAATVLPDGDGRLIQVETTNGLVAMTSTKRLRAESIGDNRRSTNWYQTIQPAWSLDPLWVPVATVATWRFFDPAMVPMSLLAPSVLREGVIFSESRTPRTNAAVHRGPLTDGQTPFGWGFGVHAPCQLTLPLPSGAVAFHGSFALDPTVGTGGCARVRVSVVPQGDPTANVATLYESPVLIGAAAATSVGRLAIPGETGGKMRELRLIADAVVEGRPDGADPFDIRDAMNWFAPVVELDRAFLVSTLRQRAVARLPGIAGWNVDTATSEVATVATRWDTRDWDDPRFRSFVAVEAGYLAISSRQTIDDDDRFLAVFAHCPHDDYRSARMQVVVNGTVIGDQAVPTEHGRREPDPLLFAVDDYAGSTVDVAVIQLPGAIDEAKPAAVDWRGIAVVSERPGLRRLFDDEPEFVEQLADGDGSISIESAEPYAGRVSLLVGPPGRRAETIENWKFAIVEDPDFGEYRFLRFAWKTGGQGPISLSIGHDGQFGPGTGVILPERQVRRPPTRSDDRGPRNGYRYAAGTIDTADTALSPAIVLEQNVPDKWKPVERDLYGDFGPMTMTGLAAMARGGSLALDAVYLARSREAFRAIEEDRLGPPSPQPGEGNVVKKTNDPRAYAPLVTAVLPAFGLSGQGGELQLLAEYRGRSNVLRTHPEGSDAKQAARLTAVFKLPAGTRPKLEFSVSQHGTSEQDQKSWELQVFANGRELLSRKIDHAATSGAWHDVAVDLAEFAGRPVRLELRHKASGGDTFAYWHDVRLTGANRGDIQTSKAP